MDSAPPAVSVIVHTRNSAATLRRCLESVSWAGEVIVVDMESSDNTREIAGTCGARVLETPAHPRVDAVRTQFLASATHEWILILDSDEYLADDAGEQVASLVAGYAANYDAFAIPRFNWFGERRLEGSGWYPDQQIRLFRKGTVTWDDATHRGPRVLTGRARLLTLEPPDCLHIHHANYVDIGHVIAKQVEYARNDNYATEPGSFHFEDYVAEAFLEFRRRKGRDGDEDYSVALATIMAWDKIVRGLIHWDKLGRTEPLPDMFSLPVVMKPRRPLARRLLGYLARWRRG
jgi:glycosyltransferase involved in cell wall biosynthesis